MLREDFIKKKIGLIQEELGNLIVFKDFTLSEITKDFFKYNTLERLLEKIIMRAVDINQHIISELTNEQTKTPTNYQETFIEISKMGVYSMEFGKKIAKSVGTRNVLAHDYDDEETDYGKIYSSVKDCLSDYHQYCEYVLKFLEMQKDSQSQ